MSNMKTKATLKSKKPKVLKGKIIKSEDKEKSLTLKQRKWLKYYIELGNATEAAYKAYHCKNRDVARTIGSENLAKLNIKELMEDMGLTDIALLNVIIEGLMKPVRIHGTNDSFVELPDYATRHKFLETALKLKGKYTDDNEETFEAKFTWKRKQS